MCEVVPRMGNSFPSRSFRHVCCLCHPLLAGFPHPLLCQLPASSHHSPAAARPPPQTQTHLTAHHGPQAEDGPGPQRARPLLHVWGQHALGDQGVPRKSYRVKALMKLFFFQDYVDTTGNIMVDIADGIGMVSKVKHLGNSLFLLLVKMEKAFKVT